MSKCLHGFFLLLLATQLATHSSGMPAYEDDRRLLRDEATSRKYVGLAGRNMRVLQDRRDENKTSSSNPPQPTPLPHLEPFVMCSMNLLGPEYDNLTTVSAHDIFAKAALETLSFYSRFGDWQHRIDTLGWCRVKGDACKLAPGHVEAYVASDSDEGRRALPSGGGEWRPYSVVAGASGLDAGEQRRASYASPDGAVVHFRVVGPNVTASTIKLLNTTNFVLRLRASLASKLGVREASWASRIYFCGSSDTSDSCNVTKLVEDLADDWFHIDLEITWADFPTLAQVTDTFMLLTTLGAMVCAGLILYATIVCQQRRLKRFNQNRASHALRESVQRNKALAAKDNRNRDIFELQSELDMDD